MKAWRNAALAGLAALGLSLMPGLLATPAAAAEPPPHECDRLSAAPADGFGRGVPFDEMDGDKAATICREALRQFPDSLRLQAHYARALIKKGDYREAHMLLEAAAGKGNAAAQATLGAVYYLAIGTERDYAKAKHWLEIAAKQNNAVGLTNLGTMYSAGHGVDRDQERARELFVKAAALGHPDAETNLGNLYETGEGGAKDLAKAAELYTAAAEQGNAKAAYNLAQLFESGQVLGSTSGAQRALFWYSISAKRGNGYPNAWRNRARIACKACSAGTKPRR